MMHTATMEEINETHAAGCACVDAARAYRAAVRHDDDAALDVARRALHAAQARRTAAVLAYLGGL